jgi:hypothetical protein
MTESKKPLDPKLLADVANRVELEKVKLTKIDASIRGDFSPDHPPIFLKFSYRTRWNRVDARPGIDVWFEFQCQLEEDSNASPKNLLLEFTAVYLLEYRLPEAPPADWQERLDLFATVNGVVNAWPYVRAEFQELCSRMDLPTVTLPVYRPGRPSKAKLRFSVEDSPKQHEGPPR